MVENGFSILEICRFMRSKRADLLHDEMREIGVIPVSRKKIVAQGSTAKDMQPELLIGIQKYYKIMDYSSGLWCACHEFDPDVACQMLSQDMVSGDHESERVHRSAMRDFPITYRKLCKREPEGVRWVGRLKPVNYSFAQAWDEEGNGILSK